MSTTTANILLKGDFMDSTQSAMPEKSIAEKAKIEELSIIFRNYYKTIFSIAYRITGSPSDAEDVLQTIFLRLTSNRARQNFSPNPEGYLRRAAVNASLDLLRRRKHANFVALDVVDFTQEKDFSPPSPEDNIADVELKNLIRHAVAKLEGRAATAFALRYFEGYDNKQIAEILDTSQMVVAVTLHRARTRLRKEIGNYLEKHHEA